MIDVRIVLAFLWVAVMLTYLLGDVLRIMSGDVEFGTLAGTPATPLMWVLIALLMVIPIVMIVVSLILPQPINRWSNISVAGFFFVFNLVGLPSYAPFDQVLLIITLVLNLMTIWYAWQWVS
ncbi:MAG: hypothetical protein AAF267_02850 [Deinococcota bacterium]